MKIPGHHKFRNIAINDKNYWSEIIECEMCYLYLQIHATKKSVGIYFKNQQVSTPENIEKLYELPTCAELQIKNLLE